MKIKKISKRIISIFLTMVTVVTMLAAVTITANAEYISWHNTNVMLKGRGHVQSIGWDSNLKASEQFRDSGKNNVPLKLGVKGKSLRLESFELGIEAVGKGLPTDTSMIHVAAYSNGAWDEKTGPYVRVGTEGKSKAIEAVKIGLEGPISNYYYVQYRVCLQGTGWDRWHTDWDDTAGSISHPILIEAIEVKLVPTSSLQERFTK